MTTICLVVFLFDNPNENVKLWELNAPILPLFIYFSLVLIFTHSSLPALASCPIIFSKRVTPSCVTTCRLRLSLWFLPSFIALLWVSLFVVAIFKTGVYRKISPDLLKEASFKPRIDRYLSPVHRFCWLTCHSGNALHALLCIPCDHIWTMECESK